jgi:hypothetical protein
VAAERDKREPLQGEVDHILRESRMVLPGIQALFGFQLIAVFNSHFSQALPLQGRLLHLAALTLTACAIALIMAPAAYHRQAEPDRLSRYFASYASTMVTVAMAPLLLALAIEVGLVAYVVDPSAWLAAGLGTALGTLCAALWFVYPRVRRSRPTR